MKVGLATLQAYVVIRKGSNSARCCTAVVASCSKVRVGGGTDALCAVVECACARSCPSVFIQWLHSALLFSQVLFCRAGVGYYSVLPLLPSTTCADRLFPQ